MSEGVVRKRARLRVVVHAAHGLVCVLAIVVGLPLSFLSVMATTGMVTSSLVVHAAAAFGVVVVLPALAVARIFPDRPKKEAASCSWDVLIIVWLVVATGFVGVGQPYTKALLRSEAALLSTAGMTELAHAVELVAAVRPQFDLPKPTVSQSPAPAVLNSSEQPALPPPTALFAIPDPSSAPTPLPSLVDEPQRLELSVDEIMDRLAPAIVTVFVERSDGISHATGFFIAQGTIVTPRGLLLGATSLGIKLRDGSWVRGGSWTAGDDNSGLALVQVEGSEGTTSLQFTEDPIDKEMEVVGVANPLGMGRTYWVTRLSAVGPDELSVQDQVPPHRLGCPVVNRHAELVGVVSDNAKRDNLSASRPFVATAGALQRIYTRADLEPRTLAPLAPEKAY